MAIDERRRDKRIPVDMWVEAEDGEDLYMQRAANLSVGGAFFAQTVPTLVGTKVKLRFQLPGDAVEIECMGEIVSAAEKGLGMGVRFVDLPEAARAKIEKLIDASGV